jgi:hypothetical protein
MHNYVTKCKVYQKYDVIEVKYLFVISFGNYFTQGM